MGQTSEKALVTVYLKPQPKLWNRIINNERNNKYGEKQVCNIDL